MPPDAHIALDRIRPTQMYHHYLGDPLQVLSLREDGSGSIETIGSLADGLRPQLSYPRPDLARFLAPARP